MPSPKHSSQRAEHAYQPPAPLPEPPDPSLTLLGNPAEQAQPPHLLGAYTYAGPTTAPLREAGGVVIER